jgi:hypothetical protein
VATRPAALTTLRRAFIPLPTGLLVVSLSVTGVRRRPAVLGWNAPLDAKGVDPLSLGALLDTVNAGGAVVRMEGDSRYER